MQNPITAARECCVTHRLDVVRVPAAGIAQILGRFAGSRSLLLAAEAQPPLAAVHARYPTLYAPAAPPQRPFSAASAPPQRPFSPLKRPLYVIPAMRSLLRRCRSSNSTINNREIAVIQSTKIPKPAAAVKSRVMTNGSPYYFDERTSVESAFSRVTFESGDVPKFVQSSPVECPGCQGPLFIVSYLCDDEFSILHSTHRPQIEGRCADKRRPKKSPRETFFEITMNFLHTPHSNSYLMHCKIVESIDM